MSCSLPHHISTASAEKTFTIENLDDASTADLENLVINTTDLENLVINTTDVDETTKIYNVNPFDL